MEDQPNSLETLFEKTSDYLETRVNLLKLQAVNTTSDVTSSLASKFIIALMMTLCALILNIGIAIWIGKMLGEVYYGFFLVGGFYMLVAVLFYFFRHQWLKTPLNDKLVRKMLN